MYKRCLHFAGYHLGRIADALQQKERNLNSVWIDVGTHKGEYTFGPAKNNPLLRVYAFEPNIALAFQLAGALPNFIVIPMAVSEKDGGADFYINRDDAASSLLPFDPEGLKQWKGGELLNIERKVTVPTIRLDTFMNLAQIKHVDFLKIDAQGADLSVVKSAGERIKDIDKILLEIITTPVQLYVGNPSEAETVDYLNKQGFKLVETEKEQTYDQFENLTFIRIK